MKIFTERKQVLSIVKRWKKQYSKKWRRKNPEHQIILDNLKKLDLKKATSFDISNIIGNTTWVKRWKCSECGFVEMDFVVYDLPDGKDAKCFCKECLFVALELFDKEVTK